MTNAELAEILESFNNRLWALEAASETIYAPTDEYVKIASLIQQELEARGSTFLSQPNSTGNDPSNATVSEDSESPTHKKE